MTKKKALIKRIRQEAKRQGIAFEQSPRKGGNHEIWKLDGLTVPIPRHAEIQEITAQDIYREAAEKLGKDWWR